MVEGEGGAQLELSSLSQEQAANYTCAAVNTAGMGEAEAFQLEIYGMSRDQITIKTPNPKMSSLLVFNGVYRMEIQSVMLVFSTPLVN